MNLSHSINQNSLYIILILITGVIIPLEYISNGTYYLVTIFIMVPFVLKILMDIKWGIPLIIITTLYPNEGRLLNMPLLNLTNIIFFLMLISYSLNPKQLDFSKLKKYNMIKRFIFIFIILDFISTIRMSGYYFEEGIISIFQYYFFKSNLYPVLFLIILTFRNATHRYYNNIILTFVSMISILNLTFLIKYFLVFGNFVGFAKYFELQLFSGRNILAMVSLFCIIIVTEKFIKQNKKFLFQILMFLSIGINIAIITFLFSRQTYLLFILYLVISIIVNSRARIKTLITIILFSFSFFVFFNTFNIEIVSRVAASFGMTSTELLTFGYKSGSLLDDSSINQRIMFYKMQVPYFFDNPHHFLIGGGKEYIRTIAYKYGATESSKSGKGMHSTYVKILDNIGISGLVVYFSLLYHIYAKISFNKKVNKYFIIFFIIILLSYFFHERHLFLYSPLSLLCWLVFAEQLNTTSLKKS